ncbi:unnamed protein product [Sympodiomycopsis kandeliae]
MNGSLEVVDAVAKHCGKELESYQSCLLNSGNNLSACEPQRASLTECAGQAVPIMGKIRESCSPHIAAFNKCIHDNQGASDKEVEIKCEPALKQMLNCTNAVRRNEGLGDVGIASK